MHKQKLLSLLLGFALLAAACGSSTTVAQGDTNTPSDESPAATDSAVETTAPANDSPVEETSAPVTGEWLDPFEPGNDTALGAVAPNINISSLTNDAITIDQADGRGKVYGFFAHWCPHCQDELPVLVDYLGANGLPDNVDFHAVSTAVDSERGNYPPVAWFGTEEWPYEVLSDTQDSQIAQAFGLTGFPYFVIVGGDGTVVERIAGGLAGEQAIAAVFDTAAASAS